MTELERCFSGRLLTAPADMAPFLTDWRGMWHGQARAVAQPDTPTGVAAIVGWCARHQVPIVPQGGNTGLSGGATPDSTGDALVISLVRLNRIRAMDAANATMTVDAGCVLQTVQEAAGAAGLLFPLSLAAEGSCTIGGNLATNAGGTGVLRYGNARALCLGLEVVTAAGEIWDGLRALRKDNTGYDLRDLFIGSEGTLGVITGAVLRLFPQPRGRVCALLALASPQAVLDALVAARGALDDALTGAEFFGRDCVELVMSQFPGARVPFGAGSPWYLLLEAAGNADETTLRERVEAVVTDLAETGLAADATIAQTMAQSRALWSLRENIAEAQARYGPAIKHDIAVPLSAVPGFLRDADAAVASRWPDIRFITFGHIGDGNIHYNFSPSAGGGDEGFLTIQAALNTVVHDIVFRYGGSISAEHGLGALRHREAARFRPGIETAMMRAVKRALDPQNILNPGKLLPADPSAANPAP